MEYIHRELELQVKSAAQAFSAVVLTGPRRSGKTYLLQHLLPNADYRLLEDPDLISRFRGDPQGFLDSVRHPVILDEVQHVPEIFAYVRSRIDRQPARKGDWFLTGSQEASLMRGVSESMAGRAAILQLLPLSMRESSRAGILRGGYPEAVGLPRMARLWFASYLQTYLERDVRSILAVRDLAAFRRFLALVASRHGQVINRSDLASAIGLKVPTITQWLSVLEITAQIFMIPPFYENLGKRLIKSPKVYVSDSGLACHLLGIENDEELEKSPFRGALLEGFIAAEIVKSQVNAGLRRELYYFRDQQGLEVDFLFPGRGGVIRLAEVKSTRTPVPEMAEGMRRLANALSKRQRSAGVEMQLIHSPRSGGAQTSALAPGVKAIPWTDFVFTLA
jgi:predicted AAA+ superfamily ATPase